MYILSLAGHEGEGAYAVTNDDGQKALYLFQQEDDATRYAGLLEAEESTGHLTVVEIDDKLAVETCQRHKYKYVIITADDIVIPPKYDSIQDDTVA
jgi:hypothetical protein|tara:strand:- start:4396 stop:4683 length:288 start_codon:yes stop_codon:yes gene_type:complete